MLEGEGQPQCGSPQSVPTSCLLWWAVPIQIAWLPTQFLLESIGVNMQVLIYAEDILIANASQEWKRALMIT